MEAIVRGNPQSAWQQWKSGYLLHILEQEEAKDKEGQLSVFFFLVRLFYFSSTWDHYLWETTVLSNGVCE